MSDVVLKSVSTVARDTIRENVSRLGPEIGTLETFNALLSGIVSLETAAGLQ